MGKKSKSDAKPAGPASIQNRRARFDYEIIETFEAGLVLVGSEVKSVYHGRVNLTDAFCRVVNGELWLIQSDIEPYTHSSVFTPERRRDRKLLMHRREIDRAHRTAQEKTLTLIPLAMYFKNGKVKVSVGLGRGKKQFDKREQIQERETKREMERARNERG